jgi:hypothetical protein
VILLKQALLVAFVKSIVLIEITNQCGRILPQSCWALLGIEGLETLIWPEDIAY